MLLEGFRRSRNYGFLHPNSKRLIALLRLLVFKKPDTSADRAHHHRACNCCAGAAALRRSDGHRAPTNLAVLGRTAVSPS